MIPFNNIPGDLLQPLFYAELDNSRANTAQAAQRTLLIGQVQAAPGGAANLTPRFGYGTALTSGSSASAFNALFAGMTPLVGAVSGGRTGSFQTTATPGQYVWLAVPATAAALGMSFSDGVGLGGFSGAGSAGNYTGEVNPTTIFLAYTDTAGNAWRLYRTDGPSFDWNGANSFTMNPGVVDSVVSGGSSGASATPDVPVLVAGDGKAQFGAKSMLAQMIAAYRANDPTGELWALPLADPAGAKAAGSVALTGTVTAGGALTCYIAGRKYAVNAATGATAAAMATALAAAINRDGDAFVAATVAGGTVNLVATHAGTCGNDIDVRVNYRGAAGGEVTPTGLSVAVTPMASGTLVPSLANGLLALSTKAFSTVVSPYADATSLDALKVFLNDSTGRWSYAQQLYGHHFTAARNNVAGLQALGASRNNQHETILGAWKLPSTVWQLAAEYAAASSVSLRNDPVRPLQTLALATILPPGVQDQFTFSDRGTLLRNGISTFTVADDGTVALENVITTYQFNAYGAADNSYLQIETLFTLAFVLQFLKGGITSRYGRMGLVADGTAFAPGSARVTPNIVRAELIGLYRELEFRGMVQNGDAFRDGLVVEQDRTNPNRLNVLWPGTLANQLRIFALLAQFRLI